MDQDQSQENFMSIGGIDVAELQAAHRMLPELQRWKNVSMKLISDLYELVEAAQSANAQLEGRIIEFEAAKAEEPSKDEDPEE